MTVSVAAVQCSNCKRVLDESSSLPPEQRQPCPKCGSLIRTFNVEVSETVAAKTKLGLKHRRPGIKKPIYEEVSGDDLHRNTRLWSKLVRIIDRQNNRYVEKITNAETGECIRSVDELLTAHKGRGSAKTSRGNGESDA